jgi:hydrogenase maturation protease
MAVQKLENIIGNKAHIIACQQLTPELAKDLSDTHQVIMVDADQGDMPGQITVKKIEPRNHKSTSLTHELDLATLLAYSMELYGKCPNAFLVTVTGSAFDFGEELSQPTADAIPGLLQCVQDLASNVACETVAKKD